MPEGTAETEAALLRRFVEWIATDRAYNGSDHQHGQSLYNECLNAALPLWVEDFLRIPTNDAPERTARVVTRRTGP